MVEVGSFTDSNCVVWVCKSPLFSSGGDSAGLVITIALLGSGLLSPVGASASVKRKNLFVEATTVLGHAADTVTDCLLLLVAAVVLPPHRV